MAVAGGLLQIGRCDAEGLDQCGVDRHDNAVAGHAQQTEDPAVDTGEGLGTLRGVRTGENGHLLHGGGDRDERGQAYWCDGGAALPDENAAVLSHRGALRLQRDGDAAWPPPVGAGQRQLVGRNGDGELGGLTGLEVAAQRDRDRVRQP